MNDIYYFFISDIDSKVVVFFYLTCSGMFFHLYQSVRVLVRWTRLYQMKVDKHMLGK